MEIDSSIVRGYDVRGYVRTFKRGNKELKQNLTPEIAEGFGRALGSQLKVGDWVAVTSDHRDLSPELVDGLTRGFCAVGISVIHNTPQELYQGRPYLPTGVLSWFLLKSGIAGAVQVTGSHNPPEFNGFKISMGQSALYGDALQALLPVLRSETFREPVPASQQGKVSKIDILGQYMAMLAHTFPKPAFLRRIVVDSGNGLGVVLAAFLRTRGHEVVEMFSEPHPQFPNHPADPSSDEGTRALRDRIRALNAAGTSADWLGISLDGDADRSGFVDEAGEVAWPERMAALFYRDYLQKPGHQGQLLALDVRASDVVRDSVIAAGGRGMFIPAGYPAHRHFARLVSKELDKGPVLVSAEASGHFFFASAAIDENGKAVASAQHLLIDDGIFAALKFLDVVDSLNKKSPTRVADALGSLPRYHTSDEMRLFAPDDIKVKVVSEIKASLLATHGAELNQRKPMHTVDGLLLQDGFASVIEVDGIRVQFNDGAWLVVRISNTSPYIVIKFEARTDARLRELMREVYGLLQKYPDVDAQALKAALG